jgi:hypothetical protein
LLLINLTPLGFEISLLSAHETIADCHVSATYIQHFEERMPINQEAVCMAADKEFAE